MRTTRVLIADPDTYLRNFYKSQLIGHGYQVETVGDGLRCLQKLRDFDPDLLILVPDLLWGGGDGVLEVLHEDTNLRIIPFVVLGTRYHNSILYGMARYPVSHYKCKPVPHEELLEIVGQLLPSYLDEAKRSVTPTLFAANSPVHANKMF